MRRGGARRPAELPLDEKSFANPQVKQRIRDNHPMCFFNACEVGRLAWGLTGAAGWAATLIPGGASAFVGLLCIANDGPTHDFSLVFYCALLYDHPLGEAARIGPLAARRESNPAWLAYRERLSPRPFWQHQEIPASHERTPLERWRCEVGGRWGEAWRPRTYAGWLGYV